MRWILLIILATTLHCVVSEESDESNDVAAPSSKINLDSNLRRALLKALTELENEESNKAQFSLDNNSKEKLIEKASAASVSIYSNGESVTVAPVSTSTITSTVPERVTILFQKSQSHEQPSITTIEKESDDSESILTSASSNFGNQPFGKESQAEKTEKSINQNSIFNNEKYETKSQKLIATTSSPKVTTEESEAKVEDVQFFSAPLVAAFTVHQDEAGLPKKVEPIFRTHVPSKSQEQIIIEKEQQIKLVKQQEQAQIVQQQQEKLRSEEQKRLQEKIQLQEKLHLQQKQKALEEEIYRLNLSLRQQQQIFLKQQEDFRARNNAQPFIPISNPSFTTQRPILNQVQQLPFNNQQHDFKQQNVPFNPLLEAGKLPNNAQFLPVKGPVDFRTPFPVNNNFNQQTNPNSFNQNTNFNQQSNNFNQQNQSNRVFRQNSGVGNFGFNNNFNRNSNTFSIQPAIHVENFENQQQNNRFFRSNLESSLTAPQTSFLPPPVQNNRFFRSNSEGSFSSPNNNVFNPQVTTNHQLSNLLFNSGAFRGKSNEDLSLISKVLSLNHQGGNGLALRNEFRQQFGRNF